MNHGTSFPLTSTSSVLQADALQVVYDAFRGHTRQDARKVLLHFEPDAADDAAASETIMRQLLDDDVTVVFIGKQSLTSLYCCFYRILIEHYHSYILLPVQPGTV